MRKQNVDNSAGRCGARGSRLTGRHHEPLLRSDVGARRVSTWSAAETGMMLAHEERTADL